VPLARHGSQRAGEIVLLIVGLNGSRYEGCGVTLQFSQRLQSHHKCAQSHYRQGEDVRSVSSVQPKHLTADRRGRRDRNRLGMASRALQEKIPGSCRAGTRRSSATPWIPLRALRALRFNCTVWVQWKCPVFRSGVCDLRGSRCARRGLTRDDATSRQTVAATNRLLKKVHLR
jgi:hypothetical protein